MCKIINVLYKDVDLKFGGQTTLGDIFQRPVEEEVSQERLAAMKGLNFAVAHFELEYQI